MCGIFGYLGGDLSPEEARRLTGTMGHRGPDSTGFVQRSGRGAPLFFGHNRLAIQDLSPAGSQPMESERFLIVFNGEVYNHPELRKALPERPWRGHSDTETLLAAFARWGVEPTLEKLVGMFAIALFDKETEELYLIRDRLGIKPLYYGWGREELAFASELKAIPEHMKRERDAAALVRFTALGYIPGEATIFAGVRKLPPAHYAVYDRNGLSLKRYWSPPAGPSPETATFSQALEETARRVEEAVKLRLLADVEVGAFLSGGVDSSLVTALAAKHHAGKIKTFSIGFDVEGYDESPHARAVAAHLGTDHHERRFGPGDVLALLDRFDPLFDEPFGDASALPMMLLAQTAAEQVKVALSGDGGDELFLGYDRYFFTRTYTRRFQAIPGPFRKPGALLLRTLAGDKGKKIAPALENPTPENLYAVLSTSVKPWDLAKAFSPDLLRELFGTHQPGYLRLLGLEADFSAPDPDAMSRIDLVRYLPDDILTKVDRTTMASSLEARVPLLDHRVAELALSIPRPVRLERGPKGLLKELLYRHVPRELADRPKRGFSVPLKHWFRSELKAPLQERIEALEPPFEKRWFRQLFREHTEEGRNHEYIFWNLMRCR